MSSKDQEASSEHIPKVKVWSWELMLYVCVYDELRSVSVS